MRRERARAFIVRDIIWRFLSSLRINRDTRVDRLVVVSETPAGPPRSYPSRSSQSSSGLARKKEQKHLHEKNDANFFNYARVSRSCFVSPGRKKVSLSPTFCFRGNLTSPLPSHSSKIKYASIYIPLDTRPTRLPSNPRDLLASCIRSVLFSGIMSLVDGERHQLYHPRRTLLYFTLHTRNLADAPGMRPVDWRKYNCLIRRATSGFGEGKGGDSRRDLDASIAESSAPPDDDAASCAFLM